MHTHHRERLRQRYLRHGLDGFAQHETLELLLTYAIPRRDTNETAHALIARFGSLQKVLRAEARELCSVPGIGESSAIFLRMLGQLIRREALAATAVPRKRPRLNTPAAAATLALSLMHEERYECVYVISLDKNMRLLHAERLLSGTLTEAPLYPRRIVESALQHQAYAVMLLHNHPSGDPTPSESDLSATEAIKIALSSIDIHFHDHLIAGHDVVYSCQRNIFIRLDADKTAPAMHVSHPSAHCPIKDRPAGNIAAEPDPD